MTDTFKSIDEQQPAMMGGIMIKAYGILALLAILIVVSHGQDYLEGGYVGSGNYGEVRDYFTDPIFYSPSSHYLSSDPAVREMQESLDRPRQSSALGSTVARSAAGKAATAGKTTTGMAPANAAGLWQLELSGGKSIDLDLYQSGARVFGRGSLTSGMTVQGVVASGDLVGSSMILDVVPESGNMLYAISLDVNRLYLASSYTIFRAGAEQGSGTVKAHRIAPSVTTTKHDIAKSAIGNIRG